MEKMKHKLYIRKGEIYYLKVLWTVILFENKMFNPSINSVVLDYLKKLKRH